MEGNARFPPDVIERQLHNSERWGSNNQPEITSSISDCLFDFPISGLVMDNDTLYVSCYGDPSFKQTLNLIMTMKPDHIKILKEKPLEISIWWD